MNLLRHALAALLLAAAIPAAQATTIQVMVIYDISAKAWVDHNGGDMLTFAAETVAKMNQATLNSGIDLVFELAYAGDVAYSHTSSMNTDLDNLQGGSGAFSVVGPWRDAYAADIVVLLEDTVGAFGMVGLGYMMGNTNGFPRYAFSVNSIGSVSYSHTATHEVGHNLGAHHSKYQTPYPGPNSNLNSYSAGWYFTGTNGERYSTIMAYTSDGYGTNYTQCPQFSSPLLTYQGGVAGHAVHGDNARTIRETMDIVARYRDAPPANDYFSNAVPLLADRGSVAGTNLFASAEPGEPAHAGRGPYRSLWYSFTPASNGILAIDTHGSSFNTVLAVYTGAAVNALTLMAENNDDGSSGWNSGTNLLVYAGVAYRIAVAATSQYEPGYITLNWSFTDGQPPGFVQFTAPSYTAAEPGGSVTVRVARVGGSSGSASATYATMDGTAVAGADYSSVTGTLSWGEWDYSVREIAIPILDDSDREASESFTVALDNISGAVTGGVPVATVKILDDEPSGLPFFEGFEHGAAAPDRWTQDWVSGNVYWDYQKGCDYSRYPSTAFNGGYNACLLLGSTGATARLVTPVIDFGSNTNGTQLSFWHVMMLRSAISDQLRVLYRTSSTSSWIQLVAYTNTVSTWTQRVVSLPSPGPSYQVAFEGRKQEGYGICVDDVAITAAGAPLPVIVTLQAGAATLAEAAGRSTVTARLSTASSQIVTVNLAFSGTATLGLDYTSTATRIIVPAGKLAGAVTNTAVQDTLDEDNETIVVGIDSVTNAMAEGAQQVSAAIVDDDEPPSVTLLNLYAATLAEAGGTGTVTAALSTLSGRPVTVSLALGGTATPGLDYVCAITNIVIPAGASGADSVFTAIQDDTNEPNETIVVDIDMVQNGVEEGTQQATFIIRDDDLSPARTIPFAEDFETEDNWPAGWEQEYVTNAVDWLFQNGDGIGHPAAAHGGTVNACLFADNTGDNVTRLVTPMLDFGVAPLDSTLTFWHYMEEYEGDQDKLRVYYKTAPAADWILLKAWTNSVSTWKQRTLALPSAGRTYFIAFEANAKYGYGVCIDDVTVTAGRSARTETGTPYAWLDRYGLQADTGDDDHDGLFDWQEYLLGTSPASNDTFAVNGRAGLDGRGLVLFWQSSTGGLADPYIVEYCTDILHPVWQFTGTSVRTPPLNAWTNTPDLDPVYYRIKASSGE